MARYDWKLCRLFNWRHNLNVNVVPGREKKMKNKEDRQLAVKLAWKSYGLPYIWGGDDPIKGYDCSGLTIEILKSLGVLHKVGDWTANQLSRMFPEVNKPYVGCLVFYGSPNNITHVGFCLDEKYMMEAGGGGRDNDDIETAIVKNAYVRHRPIKSRSDIVKYVDPFAYAV